MNDMPMIYVSTSTPMYTKESAEDFLKLPEGEQKKYFFEAQKKYDEAVNQLRKQWDEEIRKEISQWVR